MGSDDLSRLIGIFQDAAAFVRRPGNDFDWSWWRDEGEALAEIEAIVRSLRAGVMPDRTRMSVLFAPTGALQEVSLSSGWSDDFLRLAERFDREIPSAEDSGAKGRGTRTIAVIVALAGFALVSLSLWSYVTEQGLFGYSYLRSMPVTSGLATLSFAVASFLLHRARRRRAF